MSKKKGWQNKLLKATEVELVRTPNPNQYSAEELLHELKVYQIELEMQNEELRRSQIAMEESRNRYLDLYDFAPVGYITLNRSGMISEINLTGAALFGEDRNKLINRRFANFVATEDYECWNSHFLNIFTHNTSSVCELMIRHSKGEHIYVRLDCQRQSNLGQSKVVRISLTNINERMILETSSARLR